MDRAQVDPIRAALFNPGRPSTLMLVARDYMCYVDLEEPIPKDAALKLKNRRGRVRIAPTAASATPPTSFRFVERYGPIFDAGFLGADDLLVVETVWLQVMQQLPAAAARKRFGT